jgi:hypothetical protein
VIQLQACSCIVVAVPAPPTGRRRPQLDKASHLLEPHVPAHWIDALVLILVLCSCLLVCRFLLCVCLADRYRYDCQADDGCLQRPTTRWCDGCALVSDVTSLRLVDTLMVSKDY